MRWPSDYAPNVTPSAPSGSSPHAAAPTFRSLARRVDLDTFMHRLREGLISGHSDMPTFRFKREDARALVDYLRAIQVH